MSLSDTISSFFENLPAAVRAAFWLLLASTAFLLMMSLARHLADDIDMRVIVFWRAMFGVVFMLPWLAQRGLHVMKTEKIVSHFTRTLMAYGGMLCLFYAATMISLADVTAIAFLRPIVGSALAIVVLGEAALGRRWVATLVGLIGALIIVRPGLIEINTGVWIVLGAVLINAFYAILGKYLVRTPRWRKSRVVATSPKLWCSWNSCPRIPPFPSMMIRITNLTWMPTSPDPPEIFTSSPTKISPPGKPCRVHSERPDGRPLALLAGHVPGA